MRPTREQFGLARATCFASTQTVERKSFFRHDLWARRRMETIMQHGTTGYQPHAFVVMPGHLHLLLTLSKSLEKNIQLIKGRFSFWARKKFNWNGEIWLFGFNNHRMGDDENWSRYMSYIRNNPPEVRLADDVAHYEFMGFSESQFPWGLKPLSDGGSDVRAEARTLQSAGGTDKAALRPSEIDSAFFKVCRLNGDVRF